MPGGLKKCGCCGKECPHFFFVLPFGIIAENGLCFGSTDQKPPAVSLQHILDAVHDPAGRKEGLFGNDPESGYGRNFLLVKAREQFYPVSPVAMGVDPCIMHFPEPGFPFGYIFRKRPAARDGKHFEEQQG